MPIWGHLHPGAKQSGGPGKLEDSVKMYFVFISVLGTRNFYFLLFPTRFSSCLPTNWRRELLIGSFTDINRQRSILRYDQLIDTV